MHRLLLISDEGEKDITRLSGNITFSSSVDTLGMALNFDLARNHKDSNFLLTEEVNAGSFISFLGEEELFFGIVIDSDLGKFKRSIKCLDLSFYLNKNKLIKQFKNTGADAAIKNVCSSIGVEVGVIAPMATSITKIYKNNTVAEIILDILKQVTEETGKKYRMEVNSRKLDIKPEGYEKVKARYDFQGNVTKSESIADMKNSIVVTSNNQDDTNTLAEKRDESSIKRYGMLQEVIQVEPKDISKVRNIASKKLEELNKILSKVSIEVFGSDNLRAGRTLEVVNEEFGLKGEYLIRSCRHSYQKYHKTALELGGDLDEVSGFTFKDIEIKR